MMRTILVAFCAAAACALSLPVDADAQVVYGASVQHDSCTTGYLDCTKGAILAIDSTTGATLGSVGIWQHDRDYRRISGMEVNAAGTLLFVLAPGTYAGPGPPPPIMFVDVLAIDTATLAIVNSRRIFAYGVDGLALTRDGSRLLFTQNFFDNGVRVLDAATLADVTAFFVYLPHDGVVFSPSGHRLYVTGTPASFDAAFVTVMDGSTYSILDTIPVPDQAYSLFVSTDGAHLYVELFNGSIADIDTLTNTVIGTFPGRQLASANHKLYVTTAGGVVVLNQATHAVITTIPMSNSSAIAASGDQRRVVATNGGQMMTIDTATDQPVINPSQPIGRVALGPAAPLAGMFLDLVNDHDVVAQPFLIGGWAVNVGGFNDGPGIDLIEVRAAPTGGGPTTVLGHAEYFRPRGDVAAIFGPGYLHSGYLMPVHGLAPGEYVLTVAARSSRTGEFIMSRSVTLMIGVTSPTAILTSDPTSVNFGATTNGPDGSLTSLTPPQVVTVGYLGAPPAWTATSNEPWVKIANGAGTGLGQFTVSMDLLYHPIGAATDLSATITLSAPTATPVSIDVHLTVQPTATSAPPFGQVDAPAQDATGQAGAIGVSGWALDDVNLAGVKVYRGCLPFDPPQNCQTIGGASVVFIGDAAFLAGARPDVEAAFPTSPRSHAAGWGLQILTNMLPDVPAAQPFGGQGTITLYAFATDRESHTTLLGRTTVDNAPTSITLDNASLAKPFGTMDVPAQGQTLGSMQVNFGWALTPDTNTIADATDILIPTDGTTMFQFIDGVPRFGHNYNMCRGSVGNPPPAGVFCNDDVSNVFGNVTPQPPMTARSSNPTKFRNLDAGRGAINAFSLDTTTLSNGLHTIAWSVADSAGRLEGIGSRFFMVLNGVSRESPDGQRLLDAPAANRGVASQLDAFRLSARPVSVRTGFDLRTPMKAARRSPDGTIAVAIPTSGRLELSLAGPASGGYLVVSGALRDLPVGSRLDLETGVFTWAPPPMMFGTYRLVLLTGRDRVNVDVTIGGSPNVAAGARGRH